MYRLEISVGLDRKLSKIAKKNPKIVDMIDRKVSQIMENPFRFKNLRDDLKGAKRVHVANHFVLVFEVDDNIVRLLDFDHHDKIY